MSTLLISFILQVNLLIGTFGGHSYTAEYNLDSLTVSNLQPFAAADAAFICYGDVGEIYAVSEGDVPGACSYDANHMLTGYCAEVGKSPCFIARIPGKPFVAVTSYGEGRVSVLSIDGDKMGAAVQQIKFRGHGPVLTNDAQEHARAHSIRPVPDALGGKGKWMLAADLGSDRIRVLKITDRARKPLRHCWWYDAKTPKGTGPRHMEFNEKAGLLYVIGELSGEIIVYSVKGPRLKMVQHVQAEEVGAGASADIHLHPSGRWLYASHRNGNDGISVFAVGEDGLLTKVGYQNCGNHPRNFAIAPDGCSIIVGCKNDKTIETYPVDPQTGLIGERTSVVSFAEDEPVCLLFGNEAYSEKHETVSVKGSVGNLSCDIDRPKTSGKCPVAIVCHGMMDDKHKDNMMAVADSLTSNGFTTVRFDFDGHGESEGELVDMTVDKEVQDLKCIYDYIASQPWADTTRIAIVGHSLGGMVASIAAGDLGDSKVCAAVLHAPGAFLCDAARKGELFGTSFDPQNPPETIDLWGEKLGRGFITSCIGTDVYDRASKFTGPMLIIQGSADSEKIIAGAKLYKEHMPNAEYKELEGFTHSFEEDFSAPAKLTVEFLKKR